MDKAYNALLSEDAPGVLSFSGARMALMDIESGFWGLRRQIEALVGRRLTDAVLQQAGANGGASFARAFMEHTPNVDAAATFRDCVAAYQAAGFGRFTIEEMEWPIGRVVITGDETTESWMARRHERTADGPVCAYTAGVLVGFVNVLSGRRDVVCVEHTCQADGAKVCVFELLPSGTTNGDPVVTFDPDPALSRQLNLLELLFDRMPMGIVIVDRDYRVRRFNPTWAEFTERRTPSSAKSVVPGVSLFEFAPGAEDEIRAIYAPAMAGETVRFEATPLTSGDTVSYWDTVLTPLIEEGEVVGVLNVTIDVTERVEAEEEVRRHRDHLESMVAQRTRELSALLDVSHKVNSTLELETLLDMILGELKTVVDYDGAALMTLNDAALKMLAYRGPISEEEVLGYRFALDQAGANTCVVQRREPVIIPDVRADDELARAFRQTAGGDLDTRFQYLRCWMGVPLISKGDVIGMLTLDHHEPNYYNAAQAKLVMAFANQVVVALENANLFARLEQRTKELASLYRADEELYGSLQLDQVLQSLVDVAVNMLHVDKSAVLVWDAERKRNVARATRGFRSDTLTSRAFAAGEGVVGLVAQRNEPLVVEDAGTHPDVIAEVIDAESIRSFMHVPIEVDGSVFGVFNVSYVHEHFFTEEEQRLIVALAQRAGLAIENARLYERAQRAAAVDERQRLARELHDAVTQTLFSASLIAEVLPQIWDQNQEVGRSYLQELRHLTRGALAEMRTLLLELRPSALLDADLDELLQQLARAVTGRIGIPVAVDIDAACDVPAEVHVALYRVAQEALNNVVKHSGANRATVQLRTCDDAASVELHISDDGRGFDPDSVPGDHLGLTIMQERADSIRATLTIESRPGVGTDIVVTWTP